MGRSRCALPARLLGDFLLLGALTTSATLSEDHDHHGE